ncbi:transaldolase family protein, partial [Enterococcus faecalis]|uniref:transaldolase family protein n=1 Tax=Enterococcus faecalis TaxID=1351 RepID=UPI003D6B3BDE
LAGVTSNPSIVKQAGKIGFFAQTEGIKKSIGQASLHVQVVGQTTEEMLEDAQTIVHQLGQETFIKIPVNETGLPGIQPLKL